VDDVAEIPKQIYTGTALFGEQWARKMCLIIEQLSYYETKIFGIFQAIQSSVLLPLFDRKE
jgi:hypothetical protein